MKMAWGGVGRLLCIRLDSPGDILMCTAAMRALKEGIPGSHLTLLTSEAGAQLAPFIPEIDAIMHFSAPSMKHGEDPPRTDNAQPHFD